MGPGAAASVRILLMISESVVARADALLAALDPMPYTRRIRHMALHARSLSTAGELTALLAELSRRGRYEQGLAAVAAGAAAETDWLRARLTDPDPCVRFHAVDAVRRGAVPDADVVDAMDDAPAVVRRELVRAVVAGRRTAVAEALVRPVRARWGDTEAARLLPACGPGTLAGLLPDLFPSFTALPSARKWTQLTSRHADTVLDEAERRLDAEPASRREHWWQENGACVAAAIGHARCGRSICWSACATDRCPGPSAPPSGD